MATLAALLPWVSCVWLLTQIAQCQSRAASSDRLFKQAQQEFQEKQYTAAERNFREVLRVEPFNIHAQIYLGQTLFNQEQYTSAISPYEKARELDRKAMILSLDQKRILTDQLVMAYGISGILSTPLNYYNLACAFAEEGDKAKMLVGLRQAFQRKDNIIKGERMPDPRVDSSFQKYVRDPDFVKLMTDLGFR